MFCILNFWLLISEHSGETLLSKAENVGQMLERVMTVAELLAKRSTEHSTDDQLEHIKKTSIIDTGSFHITRSDPGRTRTYNQLIKSQLLCQLSYRAS